MRARSRGNNRADRTGRIRNAEEQMREHVSPGSCRSAARATHRTTDNRTAGTRCRSRRTAPAAESEERLEQPASSAAIPSRCRAPRARRRASAHAAAASATAAEAEPVPIFRGQLSGTSAATTSPAESGNKLRAAVVERSPDDDQQAGIEGIHSEDSAPPADHDLLGQMRVSFRGRLDGGDARHSAGRSAQRDSSARPPASAAAKGRGGRIVGFQDDLALDHASAT